MSESEKEFDAGEFFRRYMGELKPMIGRRITSNFIEQMVALIRVAHLNGYTHYQDVLADKSQQWQPIDSHPKEGRFIVYSPNNKDMRTLSSDMLGLMEKFGYTYAYWRPLPAPPLLDTVENPEDLSWS